MSEDYLHVEDEDGDEFIVWEGGFDEGPLVVDTLGTNRKPTATYVFTNDEVYKKGHQGSFRIVRKSDDWKWVFVWKSDDGLKYWISQGYDAYHEALQEASDFRYGFIDPAGVRFKHDLKKPLSYELKAVGQHMFKFKKLHEKAQLPTRSTSGSSGLDVRSVEEVNIPPKSSAMVSTGLAAELERGLEIQVRSRSGLAAKNQVFVLNSPGTVDSDYRGEIKVILYNAGETPFTVREGDRVAQFVLGWVPMLDPEWVEEISDTDRGEGGFGSTGVG